MRTEEASRSSEDYRQPDWVVETVELDVTLDPAATRVRATLALRPRGTARRPRRSRSTAMRWTCGVETRRRDASSRTVRRDRRPAHHRATSAPPVPAGDRDRRRSIRQYPALMGLIVRARSTAPSARQRARRITYFLDRPDVGGHTTVSRPRRPTCQCCSPMKSRRLRRPASTSRHFAVWHDPFPKPSYLFALVGGKLACVEDRFAPCRVAT